MKHSINFVYGLSCGMVEVRDNHASQKQITDEYQPSSTLEESSTDEEQERPVINRPDISQPGQVTREKTDLPARHF